MWLFALFDVPVDSSESRREYAKFRRLLLDEGFSMLQFSVYAKFHRSEESSQAERNKLKAYLPSDGQVRFLAVTDRQFGKMDVFIGKKRKEPEESPRQLALF